MAITFIIKRKTTDDSPLIHDIPSVERDRHIIFKFGCEFAVVLPSKIGGRGYTTHKTGKGAIDSSRKLSVYLPVIIDTKGNEYISNGYILLRK